LADGIRTEGKPGLVDVAVIGAGVAGLYALYLAQQQGLSVRGFEEGQGVGGTWFWNRYPGARLDSESFTYAYSFSKDLMDEWDWSETYASQPELERYYNYVADKFDLRRHITFGTRVEAMTFDERSSTWELRLSDGSRARARFVVAALGPLSAHYVPTIAGVEDFQGQWLHTGRWPAEGVELAGKRVGVIGTGATGVQLIASIAAEAGHLTVFQRTANYASPLRNSPIDSDNMSKIKANYAEIMRACRESSGGFIYEFDARSAYDVPAEAREKYYADLWAEQGFGKWLRGFKEVSQPGPINDEYTEFVRGQIAERIADPELAKILVPDGHPFGAKRVPCETNYYETYARPNVTLIDVKASPIERITATGIKTADAEYELDVLIFATGYDAVTGPLDRIDVRGLGGQSLKAKFAEGARSYLGVQTHGFPNLFTINSATTGNYTRAVEPLLEWVLGTVGHVRARGARQIQPTVAAEQYWVDYVREKGEKNLRTKADTFFVGANIPGKPRVLLYSPDTMPQMNARRSRETDDGYPNFEIT
jgi:cation diffusion facilitator CzcD-associated flavoprotein CzcO